MNPLDEALAPGAGAPVSTEAAPPPTGDRLAQLFRHSLREGRLHPLYPLLRKYRQEAQQS